jgi:hypothetical protein
MLKQTQDEYRDAVAEAIINARGDLRVHGHTIDDHQASLDWHNDRLDANATTLNSHGSAISGNTASINTLNSQVDNSAGSFPGAEFWVFGIGSTHSCFGRRWTTLGWGTWFDIGGTFNCGPRWTYGPGYRVDVWCVGTNAHMYQRTCFPGSWVWSGWGDLGGVLFQY